MQKPHGRRGASTQAMQTQLLVLVRKVVSQTFGPYKKLKTLPQHHENVPALGRLSVASQARWHGGLQVESKGIMAVHI